MEENVPNEIQEETEKAPEAPDPLESINKTLATFGEALGVLLDEKNARAAKQAERDAAEAAQAEAQLTEVEKLRKERELIRVEREAWEEQRRKAAAGELHRARDHAMDRLGVLPQYRAILPATVDPRDPDGQAALEAFFSDKTAMLKSKEVRGPEKATTAEKPGGLFSRSLFDASGLSKNKITNLSAIERNIRENSGEW